MIDSVQAYPCAERLTLVEQVHGCTVADPYRWLEDASASEHWLRDQDDLWLTYAASLTSRFRWKNRVRQLSDASSVSTPVWRGGCCFTLRRETGQQYAVLYADETPLIDPKQLDPGGLTTLDAWQPSPDGTKLAYQLSRGGDERSSLHVLDVLTGELIDGPIDGCRYSPVAWLPDNETFYYVRFRQVRRHHLGDPDDATILAGEASYGLEISADGRWLTICTTTDVWLADLITDAPPRHIPLEATTIMSVGPDGRLYVVTTQDAPTGRICVGDPTEPTTWHDYIQPDAPLTGLAVLDDVVLVSTATEITVHDRLTGEGQGRVELPGAGSVGSLTAHGSRAWFSYTDSVTPPRVYCYNASTHNTTDWGRAEGGGHDAETHRLTTNSSVELRVIGKPGLRPTILYGYGGFGQALTPTYSAFALAWVEAGGSFVTATLRGDGASNTRHNKQDTIDDFIAAAEHLIAEGWTTADQLAICGESNGGLLTAAALTQRPELFAAAVCSAPLTDMIRYELSGLGERWTAEYGSVENPDDFKSLASYSPYHRVAEGVKYPAVLLTAFGNDTRVDPLHARKLCAALQHATASSRPVLLRFEPNAGHTTGGINLAADILAFIANETGLGR
ncbi:prolyl oligopeptidase [Kribbella sp. VKM Ac-2571]|uniref:prolyl oligopeptidase family serine peptidase n=1 Tax=Kribbella sp. VKM Ac-2571 TaxID=2512222 RepID=UPI0010DDFBFF|nr:prolyl oligopeptidase family serine peptidase [Kribbella sp. VKM Ac-2571]TDO62494.1 prolyl oligopeptidase [Kribbella sp. VKM Ac-2571]